MHANGVARATGPDLAAYRGAVADLLLEIASHTGPEDLPKAERVLTERLAGAEFAAVLAASPEGGPAAVDRLLREVRHYQPAARNCAADLVAHIRIHLFALIDVMWWGSTRAFVLDSDLAGAGDLVDLEPLRRPGELHFRCRRQARTRPLRGGRAAVPCPISRYCAAAGSSISAIGARPGPFRCGRCARWTAGCGPTAPRAPRACASPRPGRRWSPCSTSWPPTSPPPRPPRRRSGSPAWPGASSTSGGCAHSGTPPPCPARTASDTRWTSRCPGSAASAPRPHWKACWPIASSRARSTPSTRARRGICA